MGVKYLGLVGGYLLCATLSYGLNLASFNAEFPGRCEHHAAFALKFSIGGPIALIVVLTHGDTPLRGFKWSCP